MSNVLPEVRPEVLSMPTDGFVMQTGGSARRSRIGYNKYDSSFHVVGVPGHTHNASAVVSVIADYTRKRTNEIIVGPDFGLADVNAGAEAALTEAAAVLPQAPLVLAAGQVVDSLPIDNESVRFDRAIERGIGSMSLLPENCSTTSRSRHGRCRRSGRS